MVYVTPLELLLRGEKRSSISEARRLLKRAYETTYGLFDHLTNEEEGPRQQKGVLRKPFADIALHETRRYGGEGGIIEEKVRLFMQYKVHQICTLTEWFDMPVHLADSVMRMAIAAWEEDEQRNSRIVNGLVGK